MKDKPDAAILVTNLMDHEEERLAEPEKYIEPFRNIIKMAVEEFHIGTEKEILQILGYLDVNSIAVRGRKFFCIS